MATENVGWEREERFRLVKAAAGVALTRCQRTFRFEHTRYTPDFYAPSERVYYEVLGSRARRHQLTAKLDLMALVYPKVTLRVVDPDGVPVSLCYTPRPPKIRATPKHPGAVAMGKLGGLAKWAKIPKAERSAIMRAAVQARWAKPRPVKAP